jgi:hypothetical protein
MARRDSYSSRVNTPRNWQLVKTTPNSDRELHLD